MKTPDEWVEYIVPFMQENPVTSLDDAKAQIRSIVVLVQDDALAPMEQDPAMEALAEKNRAISADEEPEPPLAA